ncbi:hypothetical protein [Mesorhizobium erdmanii]|uniref:hypothetical protein n=1 Tax=Mesorhizobium erdmanii TaxID=1777866 RepID=UPI00047AAECE|nr:hypothetical protein [Mesorhizobium erdmanii]
MKNLSRSARQGALHKTLRVTPAMTAGVTDKLWEIADIVALIEAKEAEKPAIRGTYRKKGVSID